MAVRAMRSKVFWLPVAYVAFWCLFLLVPKGYVVTAFALVNGAMGAGITAAVMVHRRNLPLNQKVDDLADGFAGLAAEIRADREPRGRSRLSVVRPIR